MKKLRISLFIVIAFAFAACNNSSKKETVKYSDEISQIINQATNGSINSTDIIQVGFVKSMVSSNGMNIPLKEKLFSFDPSIEGTTYWKNNKTLVFKPSESLPFNKVYSGKLNLAVLSEDLKRGGYTDFEFNFQIRGREISSFDGNIELKDRFNPKELIYKGKISFSEATDIKEIENNYKLKAGSKSYNINWRKESDGKSFRFESEIIERDNSTKNFTFTIKKSNLDLSEDFTNEFQITPIEEMKIVKVTEENESKYPKIRIEFSDEFDAEQNLNGLITVKPNVDIKIQKLGNSLILVGDFKYASTYEINVAKGVRSKWGTVTKENIKKSYTFKNLDPQIEFASDGVFLPSENKYKLQFYSSNLRRVHIEIKKVYDESIYEFIYNERLSSSTNRHAPFEQSYVNRVGVIIHNQTFEIGENSNSWLLNEIDLSDIIKNNKEGLYLVRLNFNPTDMLTTPEKSKYKHIEEFGQIYKPLFFSNIGLTCKKAGDNYLVFATDINTCKPIAGATIRFKREWENKTLNSAITNEQGFAQFNSDNYYNSYIEATKDGMKSIIKFNEMSWNISGFDIDGDDSEIAKTDAYIYTERGVYRPGDEINLSVIAKHNNSNYPDNNPLTVQLFNPQGKKVYEENSKNNSKGFYNFLFKTNQSDPTGNWEARFYIGNRYFSHTVKIETVVPYKLKVNIEPEQQRIESNSKSFAFDVKCAYLFGNPAANLSAEVEVEVQNARKSFPKYSNFIFENPDKEYQEFSDKIFTGTLNADGVAKIKWNCPVFEGAPSALNLRITAKVLEKGGRPNINWLNVPIEPYSHYVGIQSPKYSYVATGNDLDIPVILVDSRGVPASGKTIKYRIYRNTFHWWWQYDDSKHLRFKSDNSTVLVKEGTLSSRTTHVNLNFLPIEEGVYFVEVIDESGTKHSSGIVLSAYPYGSSPSSDKNAGSLALVSDKDKYNVGDVAKVQFPSPKEGIILVTVEKQNQILSKEVYYPKSEGEMTIDIPITDKMVPNAYVSVSLIQPQSQTVNDRPIRMFGLLPLNVENKNTKHEIEIITAAQFRPEQPFEVELQTSDRKKTQYTIAVVDEGLLDITQFKTPNPWSHFFRKLRLGVQSYDLFSHVISANKGDVFKTFAVGGDMDYRQSQLNPKKGKKRFKPVCLFKGPVYTDENGNAKVKFDMPNYIGSVRIMVIGARDNSYARAQKAVPVKTELMILPTLPRVIGPGEKFLVPISVFALKDNIGNVKVDITTTGPLKIEGQKQQIINFAKASDKDCYFNLKADNAAGQSSVTITATAGQYKAEYKVDLMVRPSSARVYDSKELTVEKGSTESITIPKIGIQGTNNAVLTISPFPITNFGHRLKWLIHYPYGCIEQTTSAVFPQLYLKKFIQYPEAYSKSIDDNINIAIQRLRKFQTQSGGFSYWPYGDSNSDWGSLYAGHFMVEAKKLGYHVEEDLFKNWIYYTERQARNNQGTLRERVYRIYILALAEKPLSSEMNSLRESNFTDLDDTEKWLLSAAFKLSGNVNEAERLCSGVTFNTRNYNEFSGSYGSALRDKAMILDALVQMGKFADADKLTKTISKSLSTTTWYSTQTIGYSLLSIGKYMSMLQGNNPDLTIKGSLQLADGTKIPFDQNKSFTYEVKKGFGKDIKLITDASSTANKFYTSLSWNGVPLTDNTITESKNLELSVKWLSEDGLPMDPTELKQGATFWAHINVRNISGLDRVDEIALVQMLPSGWEIENTRLLEMSVPTWAKDYKLNREEYLDIRDDRIMWFFDLNKYDANQLDFIVKINAVTVGEYILPSSLVEAMYNGDYKATIKGKTVKVTKP